MPPIWSNLQNNIVSVSTASQTFTMDVPALTYAGKPALWVGFGFGGVPVGSIFSSIPTGVTFTPNNGGPSVTIPIFQEKLYISDAITGGGTITSVATATTTPYDFIIGVLLIDFPGRNFQSNYRPLFGINTKTLIDPNFYEFYSFHTATATFTLSGRCSNITNVTDVIIQSSGTPWSKIGVGYYWQGVVKSFNWATSGGGVNLRSDESEVVVLPLTSLPGIPDKSTFTFTISNRATPVNNAQVEVFLRTNTGSLLFHELLDLSLHRGITSFDILNPNTSQSYQMSAKLSNLPSGEIALLPPGYPIQVPSYERESYECLATIDNFYGGIDSGSILIGNILSPFIPNIYVGETVIVITNFALVNQGSPIPRIVESIVDSIHLIVDQPYLVSFINDTTELSVTQTPPLTPPSPALATLAGSNPVGNFPQVWEDFSSIVGQTCASTFGHCLSINQTSAALPATPFAVEDSRFPPDPFHNAANFNSTSILLEIFPESTSGFALGQPYSSATIIPQTDFITNIGIGIGGFLGTGDWYIDPEVTPVAIDPSKTIIKIVTTGQSGLTLILTSDGLVYSSGASNFNLLGYNAASITTTGENVNKPHLIPGLSSIIDINISSFPKALDSNGNVWGWSNTIPKPVGAGSGTVSSVTPIIVATGIASIASGFGGSTAIVTTAGQCLVFGSNQFGKLGIGLPGGSVTIWTPITFAGQVLNAYSGTNQMFFLLPDGTLLGSGAGTGTAAYTLGAGPVLSGVNPTSPVVIPDFGPGIVEVASRNNTTCIRNTTGQMMMLGAFSTTFGTKGDGTLTGVSPQTTPSLVVLPTGVTCGKLSGCGDTACIGSDGQVYVWGSNTNGVLGIGTVDSNPHPLPVAIPNAINANYLFTSAGNDFIIKGLFYCGGVLTPTVLQNNLGSAQVIS